MKYALVCVLIGVSALTVVAQVKVGDGTSRRAVSRQKLEFARQAGVDVDRLADVPATGTALPNTVIEVFLNGTSYGVTTVSAAGTWCFYWPLEAWNVAARSGRMKVTVRYVEDSVCQQLKESYCERQQQFAIDVVRQVQQSALVTKSRFSSIEQYKSDIAAIVEQYARPINESRCLVYTATNWKSDKMFHWTVDDPVLRLRHTCGLQLFWFDELEAGRSAPQQPIGVLQLLKPDFELEFALAPAVARQVYDNFAQYDIYLDIEVDYVVKWDHNKVIVKVQMVLYKAELRHNSGRVVASYVQSK